MPVVVKLRGIVRLVMKDKRMIESCLINNWFQGKIAGEKRLSTTAIPEGQHRTHANYKAPFNNKLLSDCTFKKAKNV
jgi:hypothetical protein